MTPFITEHVTYKDACGHLQSLNLKQSLLFSVNCHVGRYNLSSNFEIP